MQKHPFSDNPTVKQFIDNAAALRVLKSAGITIKHGNVKRQLNLNENLYTPLSKRKHHA